PRPRRLPLFPYTTLFRSDGAGARRRRPGRHPRHQRHVLAARRRRRAAATPPQRRGGDPHPADDGRPRHADRRPHHRHPAHPPLSGRPRHESTMKITDIRLAMLRVPLTTPFKTALRTVDTVEDVVVMIHTDDGRIGYGEAAPTAVITGDTHGSIIEAVS